MELTFRRLCAETSSPVEAADERCAVGRRAEFLSDSAKMRFWRQDLQRRFSKEDNYSHYCHWRHSYMQLNQTRSELKYSKHFHVSLPPVRTPRAERSPTKNTQFGNVLRSLFETHETSSCFDRPLIIISFIEGNGLKRINCCKFL